MHQGKPYGLHVIGGKLTDHDEAFVSVTAKRFSNLKDLSSIDSSRMVYDLPDGGYVVIQDMGGNFRVIAHKTSEIAFTIDGMATDYIPMMYSGVILNSTPFETDGVPIRLTETARRRLIDYDTNKEKPNKEIVLHRFRIEYDDKFKYFEPVYKGIRTFTQYHKLRATWYSGAMSEVVQIIGGYGRQDADDLPDKPLERKRFNLPARVNKSVRAYIANQRLPAYTGLPEFEGKYKYEYRHALSNAVSFDDAGKPWLLQINPRGIHAMPLPLIPATTAPAFNEYMNKVGDDEILHVLDRFGGLPSGELFPTGDDFQAWYRAGVIIKICDTGEFYKHNAFYEACGWSFNSKGNEGFNTGWSYDDKKLKQAYSFKLRLRLGAALNKGWVNNAINVKEDISRSINDYIASLFSQINANDHRARAIRYKIMRSTADELLHHSKLKSNIDYWENLIAEPIATHNGSMTQVSSGPMYWGNKDPSSFGALKFPEFTGRGCESFDMSMPDYSGGPVKSDTVVFGCYVNNQLTVVKYFNDSRLFTRSVDSNFEDSMIIGQWEETETTGQTGLMGYLYTSVFDDRQEVSDSVTFTKITGQDLGYGQPAYKTQPLFMMWGNIYRVRYYSYRVQKTVTTGDSVITAVCIPNLTRDCMLYAYNKSNKSKSYSDNLEKKGITDPTGYPMWTYDPIFHYIGEQGRGYPIPTIGEYIYANYDSKRDYKPTRDSWFSDSGNWLGVSEGSFLDVSAKVSEYTYRYSNTSKPIGGVIVGGESPQIDSYSTYESSANENKGMVGISIHVRGSTVIKNNNDESFYYGFSPILTEGEPYYFQRDATWITFGQQRYASASELKENGLRSYWGSTKLADHKSAHCFIGVINE